MTTVILCEVNRNGIKALGLGTAETIDETTVQDSDLKHWLGSLGLECIRNIRKERGDDMRNGYTIQISFLSIR